MSTADSKSLIHQLKSEALWILFALNTIDSRISKLKLWSSNRLELAQELSLIEALTNEAVLRICRTDDDQKGARWLRRTIPILEKEKYPVATIENVAQKIKEYRAQINHLKTQHRNTYIAHLIEDESATPQGGLTPPPGLKEAAESLCCLIDSIIGEKVVYSFKAYKYGPALQLRD